MAEEERRRLAEKERSHIYKEFQGKVTQEIDKVRVHWTVSMDYCCQERRMCATWAIVCIVHCTGIPL